ncbi:MAG: phosphatidate cytidylyltransferase [Bacteroidia bacterium]
MWLFCVVVSLLSLREFYGLMEVNRTRYTWLSVGTALVLWVLELLAGLEVVPLSAMVGSKIAMLVFPLLALVTLFDASVEAPVPHLAVLTMGWIYSFVPIWLLYQLSVPMQPSYLFHLPLGILLLTWTLDVMAYFGGRWFGRHPLFPRVSPRKTWEGAAIGAASCLLGAWAMQTWLQPEGYHWMVIAGIIAVFSQLGDLVESMIKRSINIKDSGSLLPGHGGMLDRFDGMFIALPFIYFYLAW